MISTIISAMIRFFIKQPKVEQLMALRIENNFFVWNKKDNAEILSEYFKSGEFSCQCSNTDCVEQKISLSLISKLTELRKSYGSAIKITSGYRCQKHQEALAAGGKETAKNSQHVLGNACDIWGKDLEQLWLLSKNLFNGRGLATSFIHLDVRVQTTEWKYKKS